MNTVANPPARNTKVMNRFDLTSRLIAKLKNDEAVIGGIGNTNFDLWAAGHRPQNFYMLGSMGLAFPIALGVALAQPKRRVFALEGDGSLLMQLGSLSTIAALSPKNLTMVVMDNGIYQITGAQPTPAAAVSDIVAVAAGCGLANSAWAADDRFVVLQLRDQPRGEIEPVHHLGVAGRGVGDGVHGIAHLSKVLPPVNSGDRISATGACVVMACLIDRSTMNSNSSSLVAV